jgi:hypothetical protein
VAVAVAVAVAARLCKIAFSCTFAVIQMLDKYWLLSYFLGDFNYFQVKICSCPSTDVSSFVEKYLKIKYAILTHNIVMDISESFELLNGSQLKTLKMLTDVRISCKETTNCFCDQPSSLYSTYPAICDRTRCIRLYRIVLLFTVLCRDHSVSRTRDEVPLLDGKNTLVCNSLSNLPEDILANQ